MWLLRGWGNTAPPRASEGKLWLSLTRKLLAPHLATLLEKKRQNNKAIRPTIPCFWNDYGEPGCCSPCIPWLAHGGQVRCHSSKLLRKSFKHGTFLKQVIEGVGGRKKVPFQQQACIHTEVNQSTSQPQAASVDFTISWNYLERNIWTVVQVLYAHNREEVWRKENGYVMS